MPRKKIVISPIEVIHCKDFDIEVMQDDWNIRGRGSNHKKAFHERVNEILLKLIDDFVDEQGHLKPLIKRTDNTNQRNDYLLSPTSFARRCESLDIDYIWESDQQLRKAYFKILSIEIKKNILIKLNANPPPPRFRLKELKEYLDNI
jgi:hypothetical protein